MVKRLAFVLPCALVLCSALWGCGDESNGYDPVLLEQYRSALPTRSTLAASTPQTVTRDVGDPALYPRASWQLVKGVNAAVAGIVDTLEAVTSFPPTVFNSETQEFVWGPWDFENEPGMVAAFIRKEPEGADFRYVYVLLRGVGNDLATYKPVILGTASPDPEDEEHGLGITLWDFDASADFLATEFPDDYVADEVPHGRFIALYLSGHDPDAPENEVAWVVAYMRDFVDANAAGKLPVDLDYFYGHFENHAEELAVDFVNFEGTFDVTEPADSVAEDIGVWMAFINNGAGRAQATASGGSLGESGSIAAVECWDASIDRTYLSFTGQDDGGAISYLEPVAGTEALCSMPFSNDLATLGMPSLDNVDPDLEAAMISLAEGGVDLLSQ